MPAQFVDRFVHPEKTYRVVGVRYDGSRRILKEGQTQLAAASNKAKAGKRTRLRHAADFVGPPFFAARYLPFTDPRRLKRGRDTVEIRYIEIRHYPKRCAWKAVILRDPRQVSVYAASPSEAFETLAKMIDVPASHWHAVSKSNSRLLYQEMNRTSVR